MDAQAGGLMPRPTLLRRAPAEGVGHLRPRLRRLWRDRRRRQRDGALGAVGVGLVFFLVLLATIAATRPPLRRPLQPGREPQLLPDPPPPRRATSAYCAPRSGPPRSPRSRCSAVWPGPPADLGATVPASPPGGPPAGGPADRPPHARDHGRGHRHPGGRRAGRPRHRRRGRPRCPRLRSAHRRVDEHRPLPRPRPGLGQWRDFWVYLAGPLSARRSARWPTRPCAGSARRRRRRRPGRAAAHPDPHEPTGAGLNAARRARPFPPLPHRRLAAGARVTDHDLKPSDAVLSASQALRFLADAGEVLSSSLDYEQTLRRVAQLAVPDFADWCAVYIADEAGVEERDHQPAPRPRGRGDARRASAAAAGRSTGASESRRVARTGEPVLARDVRGAAADGPRRRAARLLRAARAAVLHARPAARARPQHRVADAAVDPGRAATTPRTTSPSRRRSPRRCALAIDNARLHDAAERSLSAARHRVRDRAGRARLRRPRPALRARQRGDGGLQRPPGRGPPRADDPRGPRRAGRRARAAVPARARHGPAAPRPRAQRRSAAAPDDVRHFNVSLHAGPRPRRRPPRRRARVVLDVTERQRLLEAEREARARADFLARAGGLLDESLDYERDAARRSPTSRSPRSPTGAR